MRRFPSDGFTLIELMIAVAIVGILAAIAYPTYVDQVRKTRRSDAQAALLRTAQVLERCYTEYNAYNHRSCTAVNAAGTGLDTGYTSTEGGFYTLSAAFSPTSPLDTATSFTLTAAPNGDQTADECGNLTYDHIGTKDVSGDADGDGTTASDADDVEICW